MDDDRWTMTCSAVYLRRQMKRLRGSVDETAYFGLEKRRRKDSFMSGLRHYKQLDAWKLAMTLVESTYRLTRLLPDTERYSLISQMQRCSVSIPSNIAEGQARGKVRSGLHFVRIAIGSGAELDTQVEVARRLRYVNVDQTRQLDAELERVLQMLYGMRREHLRRVALGGATAFLIFISCVITAG
jgi:four helix bundle protein